MPDRTITTSTGTIVSLAHNGEDTVVLLDHPKAPADMRPTEAGRVIDCSFQFAPDADWALSPEGLRAIADIIDGGTTAITEPIGLDGDTGTRAIATPGKTFTRYTEHNDHEGETWTFWLQRDGNEEALNWLADFLANVNAEELDPEHELFLDDVLPEDHVDVLARWGGEAYFPLHNKVIGTMTIPEKFSPGDLYKGDVAELFAVVSDGE